MLTPQYMKDAEQAKLFAGAKVGDVITFNPTKANETLAKLVDEVVKMNDPVEIGKSFKAISKKMENARNSFGINKQTATELGMVKVWEVEYDANGAPTLTEKYTINWGEDKGVTMGIDFDAAGNLYIVSNSNERLMVYSLPNTNNTYATRIAYQYVPNAVENASAIGINVVGFTEP